MTFDSISLEQVQRYWDARPCNVRHSPAPVGSLSYFEQVRKRKYLVEPHILEFADFLQWCGGRVLEVGCGIGTDTISFAQTGALVTAVDLSSESLRLAERRAQAYGLSGQINFYQANAEHLDATVPVEPYDLVYSFGVLHHTPSPAAAFAQLHQYLKPDGLLKVMVYYRYSWKVLKITKGRPWRDDLIARHSEAATGCPVTYAFTKKSLRDLLHRSGFEVIGMAVDHIFPYRVKDYVQYHYVKSLPIRLIPPRLFRWLEHRIGWHLLVTARPYQSSA